MALAAAVSAGPWGCKRPAVGVSQPRPSTPEIEREPLALIRAARCGECHGKMEQEWRHSAHARADVSPLYRAMRAGARAMDCERCHAPLRRLSPADPAAAEGVTCDVCHTFAGVQLGRPGGGGFVLHPEESVRYGPLCDAKQHYFHTMGCSPLHRDGTFCAACHDLRLPAADGGTIGIYQEYAEWRDEAAASDGRSCQQCHMPGERAEVAVGSPMRESVRGHDFQLRGALLRLALSGRAVISARAGGWHVAVSLSNTGAGHSVPSGLPGRQVVIAVEAVDVAGQLVQRQELAYGRVLVDAAGREVPYYAAVRQQADTRIRPGETRAADFDLIAPAAVALRVRVFWRPLAPAIAARIGVGALADAPMLAASQALPLRPRPAGATTAISLVP
jgi:hypothetical protein